MRFRRSRWRGINGARNLRRALGCVLIALPLALGGAHPEVNAILALIMVGLLAVLVWRFPEDRPFQLTLPVLVALGALAATLVQLVPLPMGLLEVVSSGAHDVLSLDKERAWAPLSMDPPATAHEALKLSSYAAGALLAIGLFSSSARRRRELLVWISAAGGVVMVLGLVHALARFDRPWGTFGHPAEHFISTFINPNHLAGFLGFCSIIALGLGMTARDNWRWAHLGNAVLVGAGVILSLSRGGILCYVGALAFFGLLVLLGRVDGRLARRANSEGGQALMPSSRLPRMRGLLWIQVGLAGVLLVASYLAYTRVVHELWTLGNDDALSKTEIWKPAPGMIADFPFTGVGRGAFVAIYPKYRAESLPATFTHLENEWLQTLVDWGPAAGMLILLGAILAFTRVLRRSSTDPTALAVASALLYLGIQNLGDFNLQVTGVALPAVLVLAVYGGTRSNVAAAANAPGTSASSGHLLGLLWGRGRISIPATMALTPALALIVLGAAWPAAAFDIERDTSRLGAAMATKGPGPTDSSAATRARLAKETTRRHPADYLLPLLVAQREIQDSDSAEDRAQKRQAARRALPWINRGMYLAPHFGPAHRLAGRALLEIGARDQARLEYRIACEKSPWQTVSIARELWTLTRSRESIARLGSSSAPVRLAVARFLMRHEASGLAIELARGASDPDPDLLELAARAHVKLGKHDEGLAQAQAIERRWPERYQPYLLQSEALLKRGEVDAALEALGRGVSMSTRPDPLLSRKAEILLKQDRPDEARQIVQQLISRAADSRASARAYWLLGRVRQRQSRYALALREYERARDFAPNNPSYRLAIARLRERMGDYRGARTELERARTDLGATSAIEEALERVAASERSKTERLRWEQVLGEGK